MSLPSSAENEVVLVSGPVAHLEILAHDLDHVVSSIASLVSGQSAYTKDAAHATCKHSEAVHRRRFWPACSPHKVTGLGRMIG